jgi:predicted dehydrogenase
MNVIVIGLGSMGKRRIRLLQEMYPEYWICGVDGRDDRRTETEKTLKIQTFSSIEEADLSKEFDCAFVCTSPLSHKDLIRECLTRGWNVFTELNLVDDGYEENMALAKENSRVLFLSSTFLYREEICYIRSKVEQSGRWNYVYHIGQYLPDWHPWETYQDFFIGDRRTNGCREIMAIELPWLISTFGNVTGSHVAADRITDLKINFNDNYMIQLTHENGNKGILIVDVVSPCAVRKLEVYGENKYLQWSGTPETLYEFDEEEKQLIPVKLKEQAEHREGYSVFVVENAYKNEIREFFEVINHGKTPQYGFEQDFKVLQLIDSLEGNA